jgi:hypothetical protein
VGARASVSAALGRADSRYRVIGLSALNPAQRLRLRFTAGRVVVGAAGGRVSIGLSGLGRDGRLVRLAPAGERTAGNSIVYPSRLVREWFVNGPLGVEQGFDVARRPVGRGLLRLAIAVTGAASMRLDGRGGVLLRLADGTPLRYTGVSATDARKRALQAWLTVRGGALVVVGR